MAVCLSVKPEGPTILCFPRIVGADCTTLSVSHMGAGNRTQDLTLVQQQTLDLLSHIPSPLICDGFQEVHLRNTLTSLAFYS